MKLTGKCKKDFNKWFIENVGLTTIYYYEVWNSQFDGEIDIEDVWDNLPQSMQYGVYVDFFREFLDCVEFLNLLQSVYDNQRLTTDTLNKARTKAIEKANELYNETHG